MSKKFNFSDYRELIKLAESGKISLIDSDVIGQYYVLTTISETDFSFFQTVTVYNKIRTFINYYRLDFKFLRNYHACTYNVFWIKNFFCNLSHLVLGLYL